MKLYKFLDIVKYIAAVGLLLGIAAVFATVASADSGAREFSDCVAPVLFSCGGAGACLCVVAVCDALKERLKQRLINAVQTQNPARLSRTGVKTRTHGVTH